MDRDALVEMARDFRMAITQPATDEREFYAPWPKEGLREGRGLREPAPRWVALAIGGAMV